MLNLKSIMEQTTGQTLTIKELLKGRTPHRADVLIDKITKEEPIVLASGLSVILDKNKNANIVNVLRSKNLGAYQAALLKGKNYQPVFIDKQGHGYSLNQFAKAAEFGGGGGGNTGGKAMETVSEVGVAIMLGAITVLGRGVTPADITPDILAQSSHLVEPIITQQNLRDLREFTSDETWALSLTQSANILYNNLSIKNKIFHCKGSPFLSAVQAAFQSANTATTPKPFASQDRWNPADIWATNENIKLPPANTDFEELNEWVLENLNKKRGYGISLKKSGAAAQLSFHNIDPTAQRLELLVKDLLVSSGNRLEALFNAASSIMTYEVVSLPLWFFFTALQEKATNQIEYRSRGPSAILGSIKGRHAAQGSVGFGTINAVLRSMTGNDITNYVTISRNIQSPQQKKEVIEEIIMMAGSILGTRVDPATKKKLQEIASTRDEEKLIAKYQATQLLYHISNHRKKNKKEADQFVTRLFEHASSQAPLSSAFVKVS